MTPSWWWWWWRWFGKRVTSLSRDERKWCMLASRNPLGYTLIFFTQLYNESLFHELQVRHHYEEPGMEWERRTNSAPDEWRLALDSSLFSDIWERRLKRHWRRRRSLLNVWQEGRENLTARESLGGQTWLEWVLIISFSLLISLSSLLSAINRADPLATDATRIQTSTGFIREPGREECKERRATHGMRKKFFIQVNALLWWYSQLQNHSHCRHDRESDDYEREKTLMRIMRWWWRFLISALYFGIFNLKLNAFDSKTYLLYVFSHLVRSNSYSNTRNYNISRTW